MPPVFIIFLALHVLLSVILVVVVLVQQRTKGGLAGVFGGGGGGGGTGAEQIFGSSGVAPFMTKITSILGAMFLATSLLLVLLSGGPRTVGQAAPTGQTQQRAPIPTQQQQPQTQEETLEEEMPGQIILPDTGGGQ